MLQLITAAAVALGTLSVTRHIPPTNDLVITALPRTTAPVTEVMVTKKLLASRTVRGAGAPITVCDWECTAYFTELVAGKNGREKVERVHVLYLETVSGQR